MIESNTENASPRAGTLPATDARCASDVDSDTLVKVEGLSVDLPRRREATRLVDGVSFTIKRNEKVALVGESGSGKSVTARALMRLNPKLRLAGRVLVDGIEVLGLPERKLGSVRGKRIGMAFQDAFTSLDPIMPVGEQLIEALVVQGVSRGEARVRAVRLLAELGVSHAEGRMKAYVHEFSGGMRQRVVLAMALICEPRLLIADEPTTALDVRIAQQVLDVLDDVAARRELAVLLITHDMGVVASFAERVLVMYSGRIVEDAQVDALFERPIHPYTEGLLAAVPRVDRTVERLAAVQGSPVAPGERPAGCAFHPRCAAATDVCRGVVPPLRTFGARRIACHHAEERGASDAV
ncbi:ABC transporter ATP-binding protein [Paraburkholderia susongensis]|nr:ABC transporter ATP-binding protein [Paraburkholderia susongensis]